MQMPIQGSAPTNNIVGTVDVSVSFTPIFIFLHVKVQLKVDSMPSNSRPLGTSDTGSYYPGIQSLFVSTLHICLY